MPPAHRTHLLIRNLLSHTGLLPTARGFTQVILGNERLRSYCTSEFSSGKIAFGEKNHYAIPVFPLQWVRVDIDGADFNVDLTSDVPLPFADNSQHLLYAAHLIEHLDDASFKRFVDECYRILIPGGGIRIEAPDTERLVKAYRRSDRTILDHFRNLRHEQLIARRGFPRRYLEDHLTVLGEISSYIDPSTDGGHVPVYASPGQFVAQLDRLDFDSFARWCVSLQTPTQLSSGGHRNWMSWGKLESTLRSSGFARVLQVDFGETTLPEVVLNRGWGSIREKPHRAAYSVYVEAIK